MRNERECASPRPRLDNRQSPEPFTIIELLMVIGIIALLAAMVLPVLAMARESGRASFCVNNVSQLTKANLLYADDYGKLIAASPDAGNLIRWHGVRSSADLSSDFDFTKSGLYNYISKSGEIKRCPTLGIMTDLDLPAYEKGGGGYGYNECIGSRMYFVANAWGEEAKSEGLALQEIRNAAETVMFTDSACVVNSSGNHEENADAGRLAENSFSKSPFYVSGMEPQPAWGFAWPTMHFRHSRTANVGWVDGHVSAPPIQFSNGRNWEKLNLGWFGEHQDNTYFDPF